MSDGSTFFDTNVLVYLFDRSAAAKQKRARALLAELAPAIVISTQVLQEFYVTTTAKLTPPLSPEDAESQVRNFSAFDVVAIDVALVRSAISLSREHKLSLWDALIVESARARGCTRLLTEDLQHGREFGRLRVENPFRPT
jgi:predicted nucleic acid-binding protein